MGILDCRQFLKVSALAIVTSAIPINIMSKVFIVSTPNTNKDFFYKLYQDALFGESHYVAYHADYKDYPDFQNEEWEREMKANLGEKHWRRMYLCEFLEG
jgi:hypothetical protein